MIPNSRAYQYNSLTARERMVAILILVLLACIIFAVVGNQDMEQAQKDADMYCDNVAQNIHPDYKGIAPKLCSNHTGAQDAK